MPSGAKKRTYAEDSFDLDEFKRTQEKKTWLAEYNRQNKKLINLLIAVGIIGFAALGYLLFVVLQYYINMWR
ncbi:MAG: hypothetical protein FWC55_00405 [Firmicutes bacterium]|nr:hypothetical protein [Bacillota bacterium]